MLLAERWQEDFGTALRRWFRAKAKQWWEGGEEAIKEDILRVPSSVREGWFYESRLYKTSSKVYRIPVPLSFVNIVLILALVEDLDKFVVEIGGEEES